MATATMSSASGSANCPTLADCPPRFATPRNLDRPTLGGRAAEVAEMLGYPFMPWQQYVADVALELDPETGLLFYRSVDLLVPRQSGKTTLVLALAVHRARAWGRRQNIAYAAQTRNDARKKWEDDHVQILEASAFGRRKPKPYRIRLTNGNEAIAWDNGSLHGIVAATEKSGHGSTLDLGFIDEAFSQSDARLEQAFKPAQITRPDPQLYALSTAGRTPESSPYLWSKVEAGRARCAAGDHPRVAYFEWSAPDDAPRDDPETWWACMPALGHTIDVDAVAADFATMEAAEFDRAYLNRWNPHLVESVIPGDSWMTGAVSQGLEDPVSFAFDVSPDGAFSSIVAAGAAVGDPLRVAVEIVAHGPGTGWVVPRLVALRASHSPRAFAYTSSGPAGALQSELQAAGLVVSDVSTKDHKQACGAFLVDVIEGRIVHRGDARMDAAVAGAVRRMVGDAWLWSRRSSSVDISPLVAATLARWAHVGAVNGPSGPSVYEDRGLVVL